MLICYGLCGSFCTVRRSLAILETLKKQNFDLLPVCSFHFCSTDTRFGSAAEHLRKIEDICGKAPIVTLRDAEPIGPKYKPELMVIAPLTGNSLAKLNHGISDTPVTLAAICPFCNTPYIVEKAINNYNTNITNNINAQTVNVINQDNSPTAEDYLLNARRAKQKESWAEAEKILQFSRTKRSFKY